MPDFVTGVYTTVPSGAYGTTTNSYAVEINNQLVTTPTNALLRQRGLVGGQMVYEFAAGSGSSGGGGDDTLCEHRAWYMALRDVDALLITHINDGEALDIGLTTTDGEVWESEADAVTIGDHDYTATFEKDTPSLTLVSGDITAVGRLTCSDCHYMVFAFSGYDLDSEWETLEGGPCANIVEVRVELDETSLDRFIAAFSGSWVDSPAARSVLFDSALPADSLVVVGVATFCEVDPSASATVVVTDDHGNTYTQIGTYEGTTGARLSLWYTFDSTGGFTVTATPSHSVYHAIAVGGFKNITTTSPLDDDAQQTANSLGTTVFATPAVTCTDADSIIAVFSQWSQDDRPPLLSAYNVPTYQEDGLTKMAIYFAYHGVTGPTATGISINVGTFLPYMVTEASFKPE